MNRQKRSKITGKKVKMVKNMCFLNGQKRSTTVKNGQYSKKWSKTVKNSQQQSKMVNKVKPDHKWSKTVKNGQQRSTAVHTVKNSKKKY